MRIYDFKILACFLISVGLVMAINTSGCSGENNSPDEYSKRSPDRETESLPGIRFDKDLLENFEERRKVRGPTYKPRTRHISSDGRPKYTNRLFLELSPYLLQHAHNPVNWYPWEDEAFEAAKKLNLPVLLSIGYSTCHWCHVMEEESFEDEEIARYLNENYIAIKVDREERPDVDAIYMSAVQALTGRGGWPMTVWLTPDRKPFYGGTYFPARDGDRGAGIGFLTLLKKAKEGYETQHDLVVKSSLALTEEIRKMLSPEAGDHLPSADIVLEAINFYRNRFDPNFGGMKGAPKFPSSFPVRLLLRYYRRTGEQDVLKMTNITLKKMAWGGMYDQVGGGFHRYSTDQNWLVPHFEKMLYDNALLIMSYLEAFQVTHDDDFKRIVKELLNYVIRDMTSPEGAFYFATDADSLTPGGHMEEGYFFTWTPKEIDEALGKDRAEVVKNFYSVTHSGNFEGRNILNSPKASIEVAEKLGISEKELREILEESNDILYNARNSNPPPLRDEKILTAWNGLMISAFARAGLILGDSEYTARAVKAIRFILDKLYKGNRLHRSYKDNTARHKAYLDDYAFIIAALLDLYEATHELEWLRKAIELDKVLEKYFEDKKVGGFYMTGTDHEELIARERPNYDGALPSGNSIAVLNLLRLGEFTTKYIYRERAEKALASFSKALISSPATFSEMLLAYDFLLDTPKEIVIVTSKGRKGDAGPFLTEFRKQFLPNRTLTVVEEGDDLESLSKIIPLVQGKYAIQQKVTAYVCEEGVCKLPTSDPKIFSQQIKVVRKLTRS